MPARLSFGDGAAGNRNKIAERGVVGKTLSRTVSSIQASTTLPGMPEGDYRMIVFTTEYADAGQASETVVMSKDAGRWGVIGYFIR